MPYFRIVVLDKQKDPWGKFLENLGDYNPRTKKLNINAESIKSWLAKGAQPSSTVHNILVTQGIIEGKKVRVSRLSKRRKEKLDKKKKDTNDAAEAKKAAASKAAETKPVEETAPAEEVKPVEEIKPVEEVKPAEKPKVEEAKTE